MPRSVNAAIPAAALLLAPALSRAQAFSAIDRAGGFPGGLALPVPGVAAAEEPTALQINPAGVGFVDGLNLQYFHEGGVTPGSSGDGIYAANRLGPLGVGFSHEWMRPDEGASYRRVRLGLTLGDGRASSLGIAWNWVTSADPAIERVGGFDLGATWRPLRFLSVGAAMLGRDAGAGIPVRYDVGLATRLLDDGLTLSADLLANDVSSAFDVTHAALGAALETPLGVAIGAQVQLPLTDLAGPAGDVAAVISLSWNAAHSGLVGAATRAGGETGWLTGLRVSRERYRSPSGGSGAPTIDVDDALSRRRTLFLDLGDRDPYGTLLSRLEQARDDGSVAGLVLKIDGLPVGAGRAEELRGAISRLAARKPVVAYLTGGGTRAYWVAAAATAIAAPPGAPLLVNGIGRSQLYLRDALARLGVAFDVVKAGAYKSATEPLVRQEPSQEAREAMDAVLDDVYGRIVADLAQARKLPPERIRALLDEGLFDTERARDAGLLDAALWPDEVEGFLRKVSGRRLRKGGRYEPELERTAQRWGLPPVVEVIPLEGVIAHGKSREPLGQDAIAGADTVARAIARAARDGRVKAIVLRIDSPGGDGAASDLIWREVVRARRRGKPVVASMGDVAASGGYLVAVGADAIVAEPSTITGSIGVFAAKPDLSGLLGKASVSRAAFTRGENAELTSVFRPWSTSERAVLEKEIQAFYRSFLDKVSQGRNLPVGEVEPVAGGRVWTGRQAFDRRLVDRLGSLSDAIALARARAGIAPDERVEIRRERGARGTLERVATGAVVHALEAHPLARVVAAVPELSALAVIGELGPVLALPEEWIPARAP